MAALLSAVYIITHDYHVAKFNNFPIWLTILLIWLIVYTTQSWGCWYQVGTQVIQ